MTNEMVFKFEKDFEIGELKLKVYQWKHITLFDPRYLLELVNNEYDGNDTDKNVKRILNHLLPESVMLVKVEETSGRITEKRLLTSQGVYEILFFINTPAARKIRTTFVNLLEKLRIDLGLPIDKFLEAAYKQKLIVLNECFDARYKLHCSSKFNFCQIETEDLYLIDAYTFPVIKDIVIFDDKSDYYLDNLKEGKIGTKVDFFISCKKVLAALSEIKVIDKVTTLRELIRKSLKAYEIHEGFFDCDLDYEENNKYYYNGLELFNALVDGNFGPHETTVKIFEEIMKYAFNNEKVTKVLTNSVTIYSHVNKSVNCYALESFKANPENWD